jgi:hypothetical protein
MRILICIFCCFYFLEGTAQLSDEQAIKKTIETFFEGFHQQDSTLLKGTVSRDIVMQTIAIKEGEPYVRQEEFGNFVASILKIPDSVAFEERLLSYHIQIDGAMANAWTPYEFWYQGSFSHCGANSFQLIKAKGQWKIIYIVDTRRKEGCGGQ